MAASASATAPAATTEGIEMLRIQHDIPILNPQGDPQHHFNKWGDKNKRCEIVIGRIKSDMYDAKVALPTNQCCMCRLELATSSTAHHATTSRGIFYLWAMDGSKLFHQLKSNVNKEEWDSFQTFLRTMTQPMDAVHVHYIACVFNSTHDKLASNACTAVDRRFTEYQKKKTIHPPPPLSSVLTPTPPNTCAFMARAKFVALGAANLPAAHPSHKRAMTTPIPSTTRHAECNT